MEKKIQVIFFAALGLSILLDFVLWAPDHPVSWWHRTPGFDAVFGLISCLLIIKFSKYLSKHWLQRREDYYDKHKQ